MRPDRIILAEARWAEVLDMIQAMNSGHDGSLLTLHANNAHDALSRLEVMAASANPTTPLLVLREQIQSAVQLIVHIERLRDGSRKIVAISEVDGLQGDVIRLNEVFRFEHQGFEGGKVAGRFAATGHIPNRILDHLKQGNIEAPARLFKG
jgi:Flp pilus assembly CpaF family ATPase